MSSLLYSEIANGDGRSLSQAAKPIPGRGKPFTNPSTIWRWVVDGIRLRDGSRLKLEAVRLGGRGRYITSRGAIERFLNAANQAENATPEVTDSEATEASPANKRAAAASARLAAMGA